MEYTIAITRQEEKKTREQNAAPFGTHPTEHMFICEYKKGTWHNPRIIPFGNLSMSPFALCLHYGQTVFEGMKAFLMEDGKVNIFRPLKHYERFARSLERLCMPLVPQGLFIEALHQLVQVDADWIPTDPDASLYIRPFMIASEERIGVKVAEEYLFMIVCSPAYPYYSKPLKVKVETEFVRAADGGTGYAKCGGNYGGALYPSQLAKNEGYDQVIWTDAKTHEFIEESGTMNLMFFIDNVLFTPPLSGTILDGVTRDSLLKLAKEMGISTAEMAISYKEIQQALESGKRVEAFGAGTAAVIAPIETIAIEGKHYNCYIGQNATMYRLAKELYDIRKGIKPDTHNWNYIL